MLSGLLLSKIAVSITLVLGLSWITEKVSPKLAGILSGYPLGTAIALYFIGYEQGSRFAAEGAIYTLAGLAATLCFVAGYYYGSLVGGVVFSILGAFIGFFAASFLLSLPEFSIMTALIPPVLAIIVFIFAFNRIPNIKVTRPIRITPLVMLFRAALATAAVLIITGTAHLVGPAWAGLFSAFPSTVFPLFLIIHLTYGPAPIHTIVRNYPRGMGALVIYTLLLPWSYGQFGLNMGTAVCFLFATVYLILYSGASRLRSKPSSRRGHQP